MSTNRVAAPAVSAELCTTATRQFATGQELQLADAVRCEVVGAHGRLGSEEGFGVRRGAGLGYLALRHAAGHTRRHDQAGGYDD